MKAKIIETIVRQIGKSKHPYFDINPAKQHYTFCFNQGNLIARGYNYPILMNKLPEYKVGAIHSEMMCLSKINFDEYNQRDLLFVNVRVNKSGDIRISKPCLKCSSIIKKLKLNNFWYSNNDSGFERFIF